MSNWLMQDVGNTVQTGAKDAIYQAHGKYNRLSQSICIIMIFHHIWKIAEAE